MIKKQRGWLRLMAGAGALGLSLILSSTGGAAPIQKSSDPSVMLTSTTATGEPISLRECFDLALKQSEKLQIQQEGINQLLSQYRQIRGSILPDLQWRIYTIVQDKPNASPNGSVVNRDSHRTQSQFTLYQPIFSGFKEFGALSALTSEKKRDELLYRRAQIELFQEVASSFYLVINRETDLANVTQSSHLADDRVNELNGRVRLGKSRSSETLSAESQLATTRAQATSLRGDIASARYLLSYLLGIDVANRPLIDQIDPKASAMTEEDAVKKAQSRSDLLAAKEELDARHAGIRVAQSGFYPNANLAGNYYTRRPGFQSDIDWDLTLTLNVPIYQGGANRGLLEEAKSQYHQAELEFQQLNRQVNIEVRRLHSLLLSNIDETEMYQIAYEKAKRSYDAQVKEYRLGLVNNLDVLAALNTMEAAKEAYDGAAVSAKLAVLDLWAATETTPEKQN